ncbi:hypothetical protein IW136_005834 [Coemansia sp. RSA 678]|nr:hypothetical protein IW136_005834 [Coemansia sp. RSA 678]
MELHKLYGVLNTEDLVSIILELFSFYMDPDDKKGCASAVQYSNLLDKINFTVFSSSTMANLMYLASLNKHHELVCLEFAKKKPNELVFDKIFNVVCALLDTHKKQQAYDKKISVSNFGGTACAETDL